MNTSPTVKEVTDSLIEYPCEFPLKVFGKQHAGFAQAVMQVIIAHDPTFTAAKIDMRASKTAKYISLTCTVSATSRQQLDAIYQSLCDHELVTMVM